MNLDFIVSALEEAGSMALESFQERNIRLAAGTATSYLQEKSPHELVIEEDILCQKIIVKAILAKQPDAVIYSEESKNLSDLKTDTSPLKYIIDPLDGTHNFYYGIPYWGLSVGVLDCENRPVGGVIYLPSIGVFLKNTGENFPTMVRSNGKWEEVHTVSRCLDLSMVCYDNQFYKLDEQASSIYERLTQAAFTTRITGSAVADAAFIAIGRIGARIWNNTSSYDIAAGMSIVLGAGGRVTGFSGESVNVMASKVIMSSGDMLHTSLLELISNE